MIELCHDNKRFQSVKLCECGCGQPTLLAIQANKVLGHIKGQPLRYRNACKSNICQTSCPVSAGVLEEMYRRPMSVADMSTYFQVSRKTIQRWLSRNGIQTRPIGFALRLAYKTKPQFRDANRAKLLEIVASGRNNPNPDPIIGTRALQRYARQRAAMARIECTCERPGCGKTFARKNSRLKRSAHHFCSLSCSAKYYGRQQKLAAIAAPIAVEQPQVVLPDWAQEIMAKRAAREAADPSA